MNIAAILQANRGTVSNMDKSGDNGACNDVGFNQVFSRTLNKGYGRNEGADNGSSRNNYLKSLNSRDHKPLPDKKPKSSRDDSLYSYVSGMPLHTYNDDTSMKEKGLSDRGKGSYEGKDSILENTSRVNSNPSVNQHNYEYQTGDTLSLESTDFQELIDEGFVNSELNSELISDLNPNLNSGFGSGNVLNRGELSGSSEANPNVGVDASQSSRTNGNAGILADGDNPNGLTGLIDLEEQSHSLNSGTGTYQTNNVNGEESWAGNIQQGALTSENTRLSQHIGGTEVSQSEGSEIEVFQLESTMGVNGAGDASGDNSAIASQDNAQTGSQINGRDGTQAFNNNAVYTKETGDDGNYAPADILNNPIGTAENAISGLNINTGIRQADDKNTPGYNLKGFNGADGQSQENELGLNSAEWHTSSGLLNSHIEGLGLQGQSPYGTANRSPSGADSILAGRSNVNEDNAIEGTNDDRLDFKKDLYDISSLDFINAQAMAQESKQVAEAAYQSGRDNISRANIVSQVVEQAQLQVKDGKQEITVHLKPESLGNIVIRLTSSAGETTARIITENLRVGAYMESQINELRDVLMQKGINIDEFQVMYDSSGFQNQHFARSSDYSREYRGQSYRRHYQEAESPVAEAVSSRFVPGTSTSIDCLV